MTSGRGLGFRLGRQCSCIHSRARSTSATSSKGLEDRLTVKRSGLVKCGDPAWRLADNAPPWKRGWGNPATVPDGSTGREHVTKGCRLPSELSAQCNLGIEIGRRNPHHRARRVQQRLGRGDIGALPHEG